MKKQLLLFGLIFGMFTAFSQEVTKNDNTAAAPAKVDTTETVADVYCPHRLNLHFGAGYSNDIFKKNKGINYQKKFTYTAMFEFGYAYLWHTKAANIGIGIGVGIGHTRPLVRFFDDSVDNVNDPGYYSKDPEARYLLSYNAKDFKMRQRIWAAEVPLTVQVEKKFGVGKNGIYAQLGAKGYFPFYARTDFPTGTIDLTKIYDAQLNVTYGEDLIKHLDDQNLNGYAVKNKLRCSVDIIGDFGAIFGLSRSTDFYVGVYASYGFLNISQKEDIKKSTAKSIEDARLVDVVQKYVAPINQKWNLLQIGLKVGFHFLPCKECSNGEYMKDHKRRYMDEMMKKKNEPIIVTNTVQEYYYVVPTVAQELLDESANDPNKKKAVAELAETLSKIKILFDCDKDIPKLDNYKRDYIKNASDLLKKYSDFKVIISGYTSPEGALDHNKDLGHRRALAVRKIFIETHGVPADQVAVQNFTANDPQHKIDIPEKEWSEQRAVIFKIEKR